MSCKEDLTLLYEQFAPLTAAQGDMRIYAPIAYPKVRLAQFVPIVHIECFALAAWFPICWKANERRPTLIVLRTLREDGSGQPVGSPGVAVSLPLALRAYPFVVNADRQGSALIEDATPDNPTDIGATILKPDGKPGRGTEMRLRAAEGFRQALPLTEEMTDALFSEDLLEPWRLNFDNEGRMIAVENMLIVRQNELRSAKIFQFIQKFGALGAAFLGAHRISLFRAGTLLHAAKSTPSPPTRSG